jgi:hypothetical protein
MRKRLAESHVEEVNEQGRMKVNVAGALLNRIEGLSNSR